MRYLKLAVLFVSFVCALEAQTLAVSFSSMSFLPGGSTTATISFVDSVPSSNITGMQFYLPNIPGLTYTNFQPGPDVDPLIGGSFQCGYNTCLGTSWMSGAVIPSGVIMTMQVIAAVTMVPGTYSFGVQPWAVSSPGGVLNINLTSTAVNFTVLPLLSGFIFQNPQGSQTSAGLGRGLYFDTSTSPPTIRTLSWGGLFSTIPFTLWITPLNGGNATPVVLDPAVLKIVSNPNIPGGLMLTVVPQKE